MGPPAGALEAQGTFGTHLCQGDILPKRRVPRHFAILPLGETTLYLGGYTCEGSFYLVAHWSPDSYLLFQVHSSLNKHFL